MNYDIIYLNIITTDKNLAICNRHSTIIYPTILMSWVLPKVGNTVDCYNLWTIFRRFLFSYYVRFCFRFYFHIITSLFEYSISMVVNRREHRELNPDLEIRILLCYPLHHAPILDKAGRGTRI